MNRAKGRRLDQFYIPTRYPHGFDSGKPADFYGDADSLEAIRNAEEIVRFGQGQVAR